MVRFAQRFTTLAAVVALLGLLAGLGAGAASAHSALTGSSPENGAEIATAPDRVVLTFNEDLQKDYAVLRVVGPDNHFWEQGSPVIEGRDAAVALNGLGPAGEYKVNYRVTSADGHPVEGQVVFTLTAAGQGTPGPLADDWQPQTEDGVKAWPFIVGGVVAVLLVGGAIAYVLVKRRR